MDTYDQLNMPMHTINSSYLTLCVYPMFIAIGQLFSDKMYLYLPQNGYLKVYVDSFSSFLSIYCNICEHLLLQTENFEKKVVTSLLASARQGPY